MQLQRDTDFLYTLIKSLTRTEKAYFKKYAKRHVIKNQNKYVDLFNAIDTIKKDYDEKEIIKKFQNEKFVKNFPVMKNYLYEMILKSLSNYYSDSNAENEIKNEIRYVEILYKKGLFTGSKKILNKSLKTAYKTDNFMLILELLKWEKILINEDAFDGREFVNLEKIYNEEQDIIKKIKNLSDYRLLSYRSRSLILGYNPYGKSDKIKQELQNVLKHPLLKSEKKAISYPATIWFYHILATVHESLYKSHKSFEYRKKLIKIMENHPEKFEEEIYNYIISIKNILATCIGLKKYKELTYYIKKLRVLEKTYYLSKNARRFTTLGTTLFELRMQLDKGEFNELAQNLLDIENGLEVFKEMIMNTDKLHFYCLLAYCYFGSGNFTEALKWINKFLNNKNVDKNSELYIKGKIINLIIHYELGNFELLNYLTDSLYRDSKRSKFTQYPQKVFINLMRQLPSISHQTQIKSLFEQSLNKLKKKSNSGKTGKPEETLFNPFEIQNNFSNVPEIDFESWFDSKINGKKFSDIVREKYLTSQKS